MASKPVKKVKSKKGKQKQQPETVAIEVVDDSVVDDAGVDDLGSASVDNSSDGDEEEADEDEDEAEEDEDEIVEADGNDDEEDPTEVDVGDQPKRDRQLEKQRKKMKLKLGGAEDVEEYNRRQQNRGIIYFSQIPPFMKPVKLKHMMSQYGEIGKIFLKPEEMEIRKSRKRHGGNKKKKYVEGWVEFEDKKVARQVAANLNGNKIGGKKSSYYHDDMWSMMYLPKFKWHHLTERISYENAVRLKKMEMADAQVRRETNIYLDQVSRSQTQERKRHREETTGDADTATKTQTTKSSEQPLQRKIKQRKPIMSED